MAKAKHIMGSAHKKSSKSKKKVHRMHIRHSANSGYIAEHEALPDENGVQSPNDEHILPDIEALKNHVQEHMAQPPEQEPQPAPAEGAAPPPQGM